MTAEQHIIAPVFALIAWSLLMWIWMYATRLSAIKNSGIKFDTEAPRGEQVSKLPAKVRWKADNYTHLMEQPTIFYALAIGLAVIGEGSGTNLYLAWAYVLSRVIHSLVQALGNKIELRFLIFSLSNIPLFWLTFNALGSI